MGLIRTCTELTHRSSTVFVIKYLYIFNKFANTNIKLKQIIEFARIYTHTSTSALT